jgi:hypothetical protein
MQYNEMLSTVESYAAIPAAYKDLIDVVTQRDVWQIVQLYTHLPIEKQQAALAMMKGLAGK